MGFLKNKGKKPAKPAPAKKPQPKKPAKPKKVAKPVPVPTHTVLESADGRVLKCNVNKIKYEGVTIRVENKWVKGVRETLTLAGFVLK